MLREHSLNVDRASGSFSRVRECHEKPVAGIIDLVALVIDELLTEHPIAPINQLLPGFVADHSNQLSRPRRR